MSRLTRRALLLASTAAASAFAGCAGQGDESSTESTSDSGDDPSNETDAGAERAERRRLEITAIEVEPAVEFVDEPTTATPTTVRVTVENPGSSPRTESVALAVDGTTVATTELAVDPEMTRVWRVEHVFTIAGDRSLSVRDRSRDVGVAEGNRPETQRVLQQFAACRESDPNEVVRVRFTVENIHDRPVYFDATVEIGDRRVPLDPATAESGEDDPRVVPAGQTRQFDARRTLPPDRAVEVVVDGDRIGTVETAVPPTPYSLATPGRIGTRLPNAGIGFEPTQVAAFEVGDLQREYLGEDGIDAEYDEVRSVSVAAITDEWLYLTVRWETSEGPLPSLAVLDRWSGRRRAHLPLPPASELVVLDGTEYLLFPTSEEQLTLRAGPVEGVYDGDAAWSRELSVPGGAITGRNLVPAGDSLYVSAGDGVAEIERASGEIQRRLSGAYPMVGQRAVYTFGERGPLRRFPRDGSTTTPTAELTPGDGTGVVGAVADGTVYVDTYVSGERRGDDRIEIHAYDADSGQRRWSAVGSEASRVGGLVRLPDIGGFVLRDDYLFVGSNRGLRMIERETGEAVPVGERIRAGLATLPVSPIQMYGVDSEELYITGVLPTTLGTVPLPEPIPTDSPAAMSSGKGVVYVATPERVYGFSGMRPDGA